MASGFFKWPAITGLMMVVAACFSCTAPKSREKDEGIVSVWVTAGDRSQLLKEAPVKLAFAAEATALPAVELDPVQKFQSIDGFGYALTGGTAYLMQTRLNETQRAALLNELFLTTEKNIGVSYLRISIGASDLDDHAFTYDDLAYGKTDPLLKKFSLRPSEKYLIPVLKQILAINPDVRIMGSPWSAPAWMKTNHSLKGGALKPEFYDAYARYFVRYVKAMAKEGIPIDAVTLQNEPENPKNNPSMLMTADDQAFFIRDHLGPAFVRDSVATKIVIYDHNCDHPEYPVAVLNDRLANKFINGSAFHLYLGEISALTTVHTAHPDRQIYFTEQWTSPHGEFSGDLAWHTKNLIIGATRNWSRNVLEWNLAADANFRPHTDQGGCTECMGALTIGNGITRNVSYYIIAQASKFVRPGSVRIASTTPGNLSNVAFVTPEGKKVLIVLNDGDAPIEFAIRYLSQNAVAALPPKSVGTFVWP